MKSKISYLSLNSSNIDEVSRLLAEFHQEITFKSFEQAGISSGDDDQINGNDVQKNLSEVAKLKLKHAFKNIGSNNPCFLELSGLQVEDGNFYSEASFSNIGEENFLSKYRGCKATSIISVAYTEDGMNIQVFEGSLPGNIAKDKPFGNIKNGWDRIWIPDGYSKTLSEMSTFKFIVNARLKPYLELAYIIRNHEYSGVFEVHITVESGNVENEEKFKKLCEEQGCKSIMIELPKGGKLTQSIFILNRGALKDVHNQAFQLSKIFAKNGFNIYRTKIEAMYSNSGVPETEEEAKKLSAENYFEFHIKVTFENDSDIEKLKDICSKHDSHLSRNALKKLDSGRLQRFVTLRLYNIGKITAGSRFEALLSTIQNSGYEVDSVMREYSVYDSNVKLDIGWIDKEKKQSRSTRSSSNTSLSSGSSNEDKNTDSNRSDKSSENSEKVLLREKVLENSKENKDKRKSWKEKKKTNSPGQIISRNRSYSSSAASVKSMIRPREEDQIYSWKRIFTEAPSLPSPTRVDLEWTIAEPNVALCEALWEYFYDVQKVAISNANCFENVKGLATDFSAVCLFGNILGVKDGFSAWFDIERVVGKEAVKAVRKHVKDVYGGEMPLYNTFIIPIENQYFRYLIYTALYPVPNAKGIVPYYAISSLLRAVRLHNQQVKTDKTKFLISRILSRAFTTQEMPEEEAAKHCFLSFIHSNIRVDKGSYFNHLESLSEKLSNFQPITLDEKYLFLSEQLLKGSLIKRNFVSSQTLDFLVSLCIDNSDKGEDIKKAALKTVAHYCYPVEFIPGIRNIITEKGILIPFMDLISSGDLDAHLEIDRRELRLESVIHEGTASKVWRGRWKDKLVAIKLIDNQSNWFSLTEFRREISVMSLLIHENLIPFYGACTKSNDYLAIVTHYIGTGSLRDLLKNPKTSLTHSSLLRIALEVAKGMAFLHSKGVVHRDLKSPNIMIDEESRVRIIDFGTSRLIDKNNLMTQGVGTVIWTSPEIFNNEKYTEKTDVYSFAMILWELMTRKIPFDNVPTWSIPVLVSKGQRPDFPPNAPSDLCKLVKSCWNTRASSRPPFTEIIQDLTKMLNNARNTEKKSGIPEQESLWLK